MMEPVVQHAPRFGADEAAAIARRVFGIEGAARGLPSERDQNFLIATPGGDRFVLKIANATESQECLDLQNAALAHAAARGVRGVPRAYPALSGALLERTEGPDGRAHFVRLLSYVAGRPLALVRPHPDALLEQVGRRLGELDRALADFSHPAMHRRLPWDLVTTPWIARDLARLGPGARRALVERRLERFQRSVAPALGHLRASVVHNDWNDFNVLVEVDRDGNAAVSGAIDFGDMLYSRTLCDVAIACAYAMLGKPDPLRAAVAVVRGYHSSWPIPEGELPLIFDLVCARLCISVVMAALQSERAPGNDYLRVSQTEAWELLERLDRVPPARAHYAFREACRLPPCPRAGAIISWLSARRGSFGGILGRDLSTAPVAVFDLCPGSTFVPSSALADPPAALTDRLFDRIRAAGAIAGVGRYDEPRLFYAGERFVHAGNDGPEARTIHLGLDLFAEPGTPVCAPLEGTVHSVRHNRAPLDYGPTIVLRHVTDEGDEFHTLYGHLTIESLEGMRKGAPVLRGQQIGAIGTTAVNGGWPPHLHLQIVLDMLEHEGDFPGVAPAAERALWLGLCPDPTLLTGLPDDLWPRGTSAGAELAARRAKVLGPNLTLAYRRPLTIVRGYLQHLYDAEGCRYLDGVNNVAHVGHAHPDVVRAVAEQLSVLNTNTRYLHERLIVYAERLCARLPAPLEVCYFVCSGSEANELALRLARAHTRRRGIIVLSGAYHGNTSALVEISPYKLAGPGGGPPPEHVQVAVMPDPYRGPYRRGEPELGRRYAGHVHEAVERVVGKGRPVAAFFCESVPSCGGQIVLPDGYLAAAYESVRAAGGICVADEVQVGFGRVGTRFWGFESQDVVPDVITLGKPIGNGFPLGAVVTTREIAASFDNGMEYFNTFGGNPVACAAGLAVLDVLDREGLQERAARVGESLRRELASLAQEFPLMGDVRGLGLFVGIELVDDPGRPAPAARQAAYLVNRARERGVLLGTDGFDRNVVKIKPPMVFGEADVDRLVSTLRVILGEDAAQPAG